MNTEVVFINMMSQYKDKREIKVDLARQHLLAMVTYIILKSWDRQIFQAACKNKE